MQNDLPDLQELLKEIVSDLNISYLAMVDDYATEDSAIVFSNSSLAHARYITFKMLERANDTVYILSGTLYELYFDTIKKVLALFADKVNSIKIITLQETNTEKIEELESFFQQINNRIGEKIEYLPLKNNGDPKNFKHFYVIDKKAWRKEDPHGIKPYIEDIHAEVCFNNPTEGELLEKSFMAIWNKFAPLREA